MHAVVASFWAPKSGSNMGEYEDAFYPPGVGPRTAEPMRLAVADGTSEGLLSGRWADVIVKTWCTMIERPFEEIFLTAVTDFFKAVDEYIAERQANNRPLQWFEESGLTKGAHATLLGVELESDGSGGTWTAIAIGDACLFHVRGSQLLATFPIADPNDFDNTPALLPSRPNDVDYVLDSVAIGRGQWRSRDRLYLLTDALAKWTLTECQAGRPPFETFDGFDADDPWTFGAWVATRRQHDALKDDDVTMLRVGIL